MKEFSRRNVLIVIAATVGITAVGGLNISRADEDDLYGRIVAVGIPGVAAISPVGTFLPGGPLHDTPAFAAHTAPGQVLDPVRILVGSTSNFGAPLARTDQLPGSFLSIDPRDFDILVIPRNFASAGNQASALNGRVQMFSAQSPAFLNSIHDSTAATAAFTGVSNPLGLSLNNAFGRLWPANAPTGLNGIGTSTILDPTGEPLAGAPDVQSGGVFAGDLTPRMPMQAIPGALNAGAVGTALLGHSPDLNSPDGKGRAVFSVVLADGSIVQAHTLQGVDGLAPAGTITPLHPDDDDESTVSPRLGVLFNYATNSAAPTPKRILYVSEPFQNTIAALDLTDDGMVFQVTAVRRFHSEALNQPVDLAPVTMETSDPNWASNTTLDVDSDFYVANRGNNTIVRMRQDGTVAAVREVQLINIGDLGEARLNGIAGSPDGSKIWVTVTGRLPFQNRSGAVLELPAF